MNLNFKLRTCKKQRCATVFTYVKTVGYIRYLHLFRSNLMWESRQNILYRTHQ